MTRLIAFAFGVLLLASGLQDLAFAQTAASPATSATSIDLRPLIDSALTILGSLLAAAIGLTVRRVVGAQLDDRAKQVLEKAMQNGLALAWARVLPGAGAGPVPLDLKSPILKQAVEYVAAQAPDAAKRLGVDLEQPDALREMLEARLARLILQQQ